MAVSEELLVDRSKHGDADAFEDLVRLYEKRVYNLAYRLTGNREDAEDMAQEAFLKVYTSLSSFRGDSSFSTWLYRIATNACLDHLRRRSRRRTVSLDAPYPSDEYSTRQVASEDALPGAELERREMQAAVQEGITKLSADHKAILILRDIQGFSYDEISGMLDLELGTVKSRLNRARRSLGRHLSAAELLSDLNVRYGERGKR